MALRTFDEKVLNDLVIKTKAALERSVDLLTTEFTVSTSYRTRRI